ncbi:MAG: polyhydroxyalkanoate synthesis regulator DNA-binding domain-containing protein [Pelagibacteraceae bacterium]
MIEIKKYSNRRLYNTNTSSYITQDNIVELIKKKEQFKIIDADSKKDITPAILTQIILDKETAGINLVPTDFLKQIILYYENNKSGDMFGYLNHMLNFANSNNMFANGFAQMMNFNPFDMQNIFSNSKTQSENNNKTNNNEEHLASELASLKSQLNEIKKNLK